jgi:YcaO-like protein with predicted kinase domain
MPSSLDQPQWLRTVARGDRGRKGHSLGTHRLVPPSETVARVQAVMGQMGITRIANVTGLDRIGIPVIMVCRPNARSIAVSQGKGLDLAAATASGLMESVETFHAERIDRPLKLASLADIAAIHPVIDVAALPRAAGDRFHEHLAILWIEGRNLLGSGTTWLPYETVHANYTLPQPAGSGCFAASTNGLASGNHPLEAICHAICEIVERDASSLLHHAAKRERAAARIDPRSVDDAACCSVLERIERAGLNLAIWDTTTDVGIAAFECLLADGRAAGGHAGSGAGCHATAEIALLRALTEAVQVRNTYVTGSRDDLRAEEYAPSERADQRHQLRLSMAFDGPARDFRAVPSHCFDSFDDECRWLLSRLTAVGCSRVLAVDLTKPEFGLPVVRVVIPGLEGPDDPDYAPGARVQKLGTRSS